MDYVHLVNSRYGLVLVLCNECLVSQCHHHIYAATPGIEAAASVVSAQYLDLLDGGLPVYASETPEADRSLQTGYIAC